MSRIDDALRIRDAARGVQPAEVPATASGQSFPLHHYPTEEPAPQPHEQSIPRGPVEQAPAVPPSAARHRIRVSRAALPADGDLQARLVTGTSSTAAREQYRRLAAVLHEEQVQGKLKTVMITSALPNEGKTLTVVNLALTLSESYGRSVLVIDADLRCPSVHTILNIPNERGLSEALGSGHYDLPVTQVSGGLSALTAGAPGPTPLASLTSARMAPVLEECAARFDWVLIDTPPIGVLPDAQVLASLVGAVLLVIGAQSTPAAAVDRAVAELGGPNAIDGIVLNRVEDRRIPESGYYQQYGITDDHR